jgi:peptidoglycan/LPS O-acetylase OafA/YrhL
MSLPWCHSWCEREFNGVVGRYVERMSVSKTVMSIAAGLALAGASESALARFAPRHRIPLLGIGLGAAAAVYPLARSQRPRTAPVVREMTALAVFGAIGAIAAHSPSSSVGRVVAAGWVAHALFDLVHDTGEHSRIPGWYPAFCAGYDLGVTAILLRSNTGAPEGR